MDPKLAWGPEVFPGGGENRGLTSPLRQKQASEDDDVAKGPRYGYSFCLSEIEDKTSFFTVRWLLYRAIIKVSM